MFNLADIVLYHIHEIHISFARLDWSNFLKSENCYAYHVYSRVYVKK